MSAKLVLEQVNKVYGEGETVVAALKNVSLQVEEGEFVAVVGPSGSGKSTFLSIAGALLTPSSGRILINGTDIAGISAQKLNQVRLEHIGFVFQTSNLVPYLTVMDQLMLVARLSKKDGKEAERKAMQLLEEVGMLHRLHHYPDKLSGGERQRVAIARALMNEPEVILADEPTASLDSKRGRAVVEMLANKVKARGKAAVMVTHDERVLDLCDRIVTIKDGALVGEQMQKRTHAVPAEQLEMARG
ncbi:ABC transporter ATP-binding protein [Paenibacillus apiarius]|uniref:Putative hemin import ATP-binding protein HrtA n=1 Tax=Paenibacillus apiarius TaxID=46240 RepID=A0ABT4E294_9BACL|nr:ABC transporter ATP-binding protein [Paenibacillus apiarius]MCY9517665.1 ABC transporter ATP-binding protein [Paenibacillus apiarius]MCY9523140.1 ABC transporter ATP-binding protein [Paenibacillus apiarius]MCY9554877.1 ABC transporter ATP-binding protein [Paenibacillus apiarius]MCY9561285.1 ABC transporter ATP-binding protein [Paenibacillus apiarius]MCY9682312.1 ABC transporter ATP-binding protein [Paenibacillus apiarius]